MTGPPTRRSARPTCSCRSRASPAGRRDLRHALTREVWRAGAPAQRAALEALSRQLGLDGESRAVAVYDRLTYGDPAVAARVGESRQNEAERAAAAPCGNPCSARCSSGGPRCGGRGAEVGPLQEGVRRTRWTNSPATRERSPVPSWRQDHASAQADEAVDDRRSGPAAFRQPLRAHRRSAPPPRDTAKPGGQGAVRDACGRRSRARCRSGRLASDDDSGPRRARGSQNRRRPPLFAPRPFLR